MHYAATFFSTVITYWDDAPLLPNCRKILGAIMVDELGWPMNKDPIDLPELLSRKCTVKVSH